MRFVCRQLYEKTDETLATLTTKEFADSLKTLSKMSAEELSEKYGMPYADAEALYASLLIYEKFSKRNQSREHFDPGGESIRDGLLL